MRFEKLPPDIMPLHDPTVILRIAFNIDYECLDQAFKKASKLSECDQDEGPTSEDCKSVLLAIRRLQNTEAPMSDRKIGKNHTAIP